MVSGVTTRSGSGMEELLGSTEGRVLADPALR
jgi:hypothetical protein